VEELRKYLRENAYPHNRHVQYSCRSRTPTEFTFKMEN
jgi:hypothetical protein